MRTDFSKVALELKLRTDQMGLLAEQIKNTADEQNIEITVQLLRLMRGELDAVMFLADDLIARPRKLTDVV